MLPGYVGNTLLLVVLVGAGVAFGGTLTAGWSRSRRFPGARFFEWALLLPLAMPAYVMAYAYTDLLEYAGPVQTALREAFGWSRGDYWFPGRALARRRGGDVRVHALPVRLPARAHRVPRAPAGARRGGAHAGPRPPRGAFWRVELPLARPAIAGGIALALMETLADYGTVAYFAVDTFTTGIYRAWFSLGDRVAAAQLATVLLALRRRRGRARARVARRARASPAARAAAQPAAAAAPRLAGARGGGAATLCADSARRRLRAAGRCCCCASCSREPDARADRALRRAGRGTASASPALAAVLAVVLAIAGRLRGAPRARRRSRARRAACWRWATRCPGTVLAVGVLLPLGALDVWLAGRCSAHDRRPARACCSPAPSSR